MMRISPEGALWMGVAGGFAPSSPEGAKRISPEGSLWMEG